MPRIFLAMARDGLLFSAFRKIHPRFETPMLGTFFTGGTGTVLPRPPAAGSCHRTAAPAHLHRHACARARWPHLRTEASCARAPGRAAGLLAALLSLLLDIDILADMVSIGTLFAFVYVMAVLPPLTLGITAG